MTITVYNPDEHYRCTIIRGKAQREMDNLLPAYATIVAEICPSSKEEFTDLFNDKLSNLLFKKDFSQLDKDHKKTIRNHITEIAGKLFGLYFFDTNDTVYESPSNAKLLEDNDQPAFFKNLCLNFQFPNGSQKINTVLERIDDGICFKPFHFIIALLALAKQSNINLTKDEVGYYVLNSKQVLQGKISVVQVFAEIMQDRERRAIKKVIKDSRHWQHIKEQFNLLLLANLVSEQDELLLLNYKEQKLIDVFIEELKQPLRFDIFSYNLTDRQEQDKMYADWSKYYGEIALANEDLLSTTLKALTQQSSEITATPSTISQKSTNKVDKNALGEEGERYVFEFEKQRVAKTHPRLVNQVKLLASQKGIGYDISSVEAEENLQDPEFLRMIEVKATKRITVPDMNDDGWFDTVTLTRREWMSAKQYRGAYHIYRVYFTPTTTIIRKINDPFDKNTQGIIEVIPTHYRMDFRSSAIDGEYV